MPATSDTYDGIFLGAGHNALVCQAYLGRAGLRTLCVERRGVAGGGLETVEHPAASGFRHNTHSSYHRAITHMPWYRDLELGRRGAVYLEPELNVAMILRDGRSLQWWTDFERTAASFAEFSPRDAAALRRWRDEFTPILEQILIPESRSVPVEPQRRREALSRTPLGRRLLEVSELSPLEFVTREFESPVVQAGLLFFNGLREVDLRCRGFGHHIPALLASPAKAQMCVGGAAGLARALVDAVREGGGEILLNATPRRILVEQGRAVGVELADGAVIRARHFVASGLNPLQTFVDLLADAHVPPAWRDAARKFQFNLLAPLFALHLNLAEPPWHSAAERDPNLARAFMVILGLDHVDQFTDIVHHHEAGTIPPPVTWGTCPTVFDPSQAPTGRHTAFMWEKLPYQLRGDAANWDSEAERHGRAVLDHWATYAPNLRDAVLDSFTRTPLDIERALPNMRFGDLLVGAFAGGQVGYNRPFPGAGEYRGHVPGLYLCGSSSHPGGNVTGLPGYNCAQVLLSDLGFPAFTPGSEL